MRTLVGAGLPAIAVYQLAYRLLAHRNRRQASSHIWSPLARWSCSRPGCAVRSHPILLWFARPFYGYSWL